MLAVGVDHFHRSALLFDRSKLDEGVHRQVGGPFLLPSEVAGGLLDEWHEGRVQRKIIQNIVECGRENEYAALPDLLFEQQRILVAKTRDDARSTGFHSNDLVELNALQLIGPP